MSFTTSSCNEDRQYFSEGYALPPITGSTPFAVVLCKFSDHNEEPHTINYFQDLMINTSTSGLFDYWQDISYGTINLSGSLVKGWYDMPYTFEVFNKKSRVEKIMAVIDFLKKDIDFTPYYGIIVITNYITDSGSIGRMKLDLNGKTQTYGLMIADGSSPGLDVTFIAHEMGHCYGLHHSWSADPDTEYGDSWDIMSAMGVWTYEGAAFGDKKAGPWLGTPYLYSVGWIPETRVWTYSGINSTLNLAAVSEPEKAGYLTARVPYFKEDPPTWYTYTVEFRRNTHWDRGIPMDAVLIHDVRPNGISYLVSTLKGGQEWNPGMEFVDLARKTRIKIEGIDSINSTARVTIKGDASWDIPLGGIDNTRLTVGLNLNRRLEVFLLASPRPDGTSNDFWHTWQTATGGSWSDWTMLGKPENKETSLSTLTTATGRL